MNNKLTTSDIVDLFAKKSGLDKREAEGFVKEFFQSISNVITSGESLKIDGIGEFKQIWVAERRSVNINTGEPNIIQGHYKVAFSPDKSLKDAVNAPFASFVTEIIPQFVDSEEGGEQDEVGIDISKIEELSSVDAEAEKANDKEGEEETTPQSNETIPKEIVIVENVPDIVEDIGEPKDDRDDDKTDCLVMNEADFKEDDIRYMVEDEEIDIEEISIKERKKGYIKGFTTAAIIFIIISLIFLYFLNKTTLQIGDKTSQNKIEKPVVVKDTISANNGEDAKKNIVNEIPLTDTIERGKYLTTIAQKHYGDKIFWVYIYRYNQKRIWDPRDLPVGFKVNLPPITMYHIDAKDSIAIKKAKAIEEEILLEIQ